jgi:beta-N-acetylhexosaminidase
MAATLPSVSRSQSDLATGQLLLTGFRGTEPSDPEVDGVCRMLEADICAGVILLRRNCTSPEQISRLSRAFRDAAGAFTPVISIDQEGGRVARLDRDNGFLDWMSARDISKSGMTDSEIKSYLTARAWELSAVGINLNFAPVVDLDLNENNPIISKLGRSYSSDPRIVSDMAKIFIECHRAAGLKTTLKHFPGHGSSTTDTHKEITDISKSWQTVEMEPFSEIVRSGYADGVMIGHLLHADFSDEPWLPTSLSWKSVEKIRELGFGGAIFSDDMQMAAIENILPQAEAAVYAINAGNTFLIYSNYRNSDKIETVQQIAAALSSNIDRMSVTDVRRQIQFAQEFRSHLR